MKNKREALLFTHNMDLSPQQTGGDQIRSLKINNDIIKSAHSPQVGMSKKGIDFSRDRSLNQSTLENHALSCVMNENSGKMSKRRKNKTKIFDLELNHPIYNYKNTNDKQQLYQKYRLMGSQLERGRNQEMPLKQIDNNRRFMSSSDIKESAAKYLYNQQMMSEQRRFSPVVIKAETVVTDKPSEILKRNLYKLEHL